MSYKTITYKDFDTDSYTLPKSVNMQNQYELWIAFWRENPQRFVKDYLLIDSLKPFQEYILYQMVHNKLFMYLAARAQGKTFMTALFVVVMCILYPGTKVVVAAGKKGQAMKIITEKIPELMQMSPVLKEEIDGRITSNMNTDDPNINFLNGSWVKVVAATENARSGRANILILDEFRMIDILVYQNTLRRFLGAPRQPRYLNKDEYNKKQYRDLEKNRQIFLSSAYYKHNWAFRTFETFYKKMTNGKPYNIVAFPYQKSIEHGLLVEDDIKEEMMEDTFSPLVFSMEMECLFYGENENSFFQLNDLETSRRIAEAMYPKEIYDRYESNRFTPRQKEDNEIRIISADIARITGTKNDASAYTFLSLRVNESGNFKISIEYMETLVGGHSKIQARRIRQLYDDFDCDYIVLDVTGDKSVADRLMESIVDKERGKIYEALRFINHDKLNETATPGTEEKIYAIQATADLNMQIARNFRDSMKRGKLDFLINSNDCINYVSNVKKYFELSMEKQAELQRPYIQIDNFINETISLELQVTSTGVERLVEPRSARKDRYSSLSYGVFFLSEKEKELSRPEEEQDWDDFIFF